MTSFIRWWMVQRVRYGFSILLLDEDMVQAFRSSLNIYCNVCVSREIYRLGLIINLYTKPWLVPTTPLPERTHPTP